MIRLTNAANGKLVYISPEQLTNIESADDVTKLELVRGVHFVTEPPEEVAHKVLEWRLAMERYRAYTYSAVCEDPPQANEIWPLAHNVESRLMRLAGLEESNHD